MNNGMVETQDFSEDALEARLGGGGDSFNASSDEIVIDGDGINAFQSLVENAKNNANTGGKADQQAGGQAAGQANPKADDQGQQQQQQKIVDIPEYLSSEKSRLEAELVPETVDYNALFKQRFNTSTEEAVTQDSFEEKILEDTTSFNIKKTVYPFYQDWVNISKGEVNGESVVRTVITERLKNAGTVKQSTIDEQLSEYFSEGVLNDFGKKEFENIKSLARQKMHDADQDIESSVKKQKQDRLDSINALNSVSESIELFGVKIPKEISDYVKTRARQNKGTEWLLDKTQTIEERAKRTFILNLFSDENALSKFLKLVDERGVEYGVNKKAKTIFK